MKKKKRHVCILFSLILLIRSFYSFIFLPFQTTGSEKRAGKTGSGRPSRQGQLRHTGSLTYGKDSQAAREHFLSSIRGGKRDEILETSGF